MSKTLGGAVRALVAESGLSVGSKIYLDFAPHGTNPPYLTYIDHITTDPELRGDGKTIASNRSMQYNVWQHIDHEDAFLPTRLSEVLDGAVVYVEGSTTAIKISVLSMSRLPGEADEEIVHHELTLGMSHPTSVA